jgi:hypothetical protein
MPSVFGGTFQGYYRSPLPSILLSSQTSGINELAEAFTFTSGLNITEPEVPCGLGARQANLSILRFASDVVNLVRKCL